MIIAFEGIDACGKETQVELLKQFMLESGMSVDTLSFPNYSTITGQKISEMLKLPDEERDPLVLQSLMTINRYECQTSSSFSHAKGHPDHCLILDRYWYSGLVYGRADGLPKDWLVSVHDNLQQPDYWILLDISPEESFRRRPVREDVYEQSVERLAQAREGYLKAFHTPDFRCTRFVVDEGGDADAVHSTIIRALWL